MVIQLIGSIRGISRAREIARVFAQYGFGEFVTRMGLGSDAKTEANTSPEESVSAIRFVNALQELGPTFVKLGQVLSTRTDLLPASWIKALTQLQENVEPLSQDAVRRQLSMHYGEAPETVFNSFGWQPLASASIGQVHAAKLHDGTDVVVKVQRPELTKLIRDDIVVLRLLAQLAEATIPELQGFRPTGIIDEFERTIIKETDFSREARNAKRFKDNFADRKDVIVPQVYENLSGRTVMVMERLYGVKITDCHEIGNDPKIMARLGIDVIFKMAFVDGFFHADPHPGNIWAMEDNRIALLDLGMADSVLPHTRDVLIDLMFAVVSEDADAIAEVLLSLSDRPDNLNIRAYKRDVFVLYEEHVRGLPLKDISVAELVTAAMEAGRKHKLVIPTDLSMLLKALGTLEGVGKILDPDLDIVSEARPYVLKIVGMRWGPDKLSKDALSFAVGSYELIRKLPRRLETILEKAERGDRGTLQIPQIATAGDTLARSLDNIAYAIVIASLVAASGAIRDWPLQIWRGIPILTVAGYLLAGVLGFMVVVGPTTRRLWQKRYNS